LNQSQTSTFATFTDGSPTATASQFTATINFGDGHSGSGVITKSGSTFSVTATHTYTQRGTVMPVVTITVNGTSASSPTTATANIISVAPDDFDGDGASDIGVFRVSLAQWLIQLSAGGTIHPTYGGPNLTYIPVAGDYMGRGSAQLAVYNPSTNPATWSI